MNHSDHESCIQRVGNLPAASVGDVLIMMSVERGEYFTLNSVGVRVWELLEHPTTHARVIEQLIAEYDVPSDVCAAELTAFLAGLRARRLLTEVSPVRSCA